MVDRGVAAVRRAPRRAVLREAALVVAVAVLGALSPWLVGSGVVETVLLSLASVVALATRSRWPAATLPGAVLLSVTSPLGSVVALVAASFSAGRRVRPAWRAAALVAVAVALGAGLGVLEGGGEGPWWVVAAASVVLWLVLCGVPALAGALLGARRPLVRLLRERNEYLERTRVLTAANARAEERARIAGEMHDLLGHHLSLISVHAGSLEYRAADAAPEFAEQARLVRTTAGTALNELRQILGVLRVPPDEASGADGAGTRADVAELVARSREAGADVTLTWHGEDLPDADPRTRRAVHRTVREGLTNVHKHAAGTRTSVEVTGGAERVRVAVVSGPPAHGAPTLPGTGRGLVGLRERAALIGGTCVAGPTPDGGFRLVLDVPRHPPEVSDAEPEADVPDAEPPRPTRALTLTTRRLVGIVCLVALVVVPVVLLVMLAVLLVVG